ncbi:formamidopyrimidine-DNA glycosylase MutM [Paenibacillus larvae subsp. larvae]|uniref:Formamidopyrimidine-DNA glycosylase MutM n=1 Tax=Paenibacillus larvae subsp. larvae TaxID=147375 RepID=A0A2L1TZE6_9BACL|nr:DNA-formamidopyrimidine glycosylase family protein [Paenibacillus larvae]AQT86443.1 endonuclease VIII [Paenibacillus larvae subsp. pulvifaciens]AQZ48096.1 endonuclease VIII [Paenibacillus larvae subsp. pulvifaciens]AVF26045.1 formamidopyrimidine-DNA glycosylase MutM [Paenibacillus larvae subsp. larvae]AVF30822.1 formamidopyrimidine-DNA glycosylase MutM [Paenibacillus larvae subsp. larvae]MBH0342492.1 formamidopyrimidine-DNA glycosylase [Paenibacillus larvae]
MPELPEMEHYRKELNRLVAGQVIQAVEVQRPKSLNVPVERFAAETAGSRIITVERRAKHLLFQLSSGYTLLLHLMLGGWMFYGTDEQKPERTFQVQLHFGASTLYFIGLRLGYLHVHDPASLGAVLKKLGPEPMTLTLPMFMQLVQKKRGLLKTSLVDQGWISGIGNCYSDEICFAAGLLPTRTVQSLSDEEAARLFRSISSVLSEALLAGGYMEHPFYPGDRMTGGYNDRCKVYDRGGESCFRCGHPITFEQVSSRKCFYCEGCQD